MSEKRKANQISEEEKEQREQVAADFFANAVKIRTAEKRLKKLKKEQNELLAHHPFLSNSVGLLFKGAFEASPAGTKKQKTSMEVDDVVSARIQKNAKTPKERIAARLVANREAVVFAEKQDQAKVFAESKHDKA